MQNQQVTGRILRIAEVEHKTGYKRSYIYRLIRDGLFPDRVKIGVRAVGWDSRKIDEWIEARLQQDNGEG